jgi:hypothetical protein
MLMLLARLDEVLDVYCWIIRPAEHQLIDEFNEFNDYIEY